MQEGSDVDEERNRRYDEEHVRDQVEEVVDDPADIRGEYPEDRRGDGGEHTDGRAEQERAARAEDDLREDVDALVRGAEQVMQRRPLSRVEERELGRRAAAREHRCE